MALRISDLKHRPLVVASSCVYLIFCLLAPLGWYSEHQGTGNLVWLQLTAVIWPYPLLLALQTWVSSDAPSSFIVADILGLVVVLGFVGYLETRWSPFEGRRRVLLRLAPVLWCIPLALIQVSLAAVVGALGYPVGE